MWTCALSLRGSANDCLTADFCLKVLEEANRVTHARKPRILIFTSYYLPALQSGGPLSSLLHMQESLEDEYEFRIITRDRDLGSSKAYPDTATGTWCSVDRAQVCYLSPPHWLPGRIRRAVQSARPDLVYLQSAVDPAMSIMPLLLRRLGLIPKHIPVLVAPRGEFSVGALSIKPVKKTIYL